MGTGAGAVAGAYTGTGTVVVPGCGTTGCIGFRFLLRVARFGPGVATKGFVVGGPWF